MESKKGVGFIKGFGFWIYAFLSLIGCLCLCLDSQRQNLTLVTSCLRDRKDLEEEKFQLAFF
jgi:hypothetical protein